MSETAIMTAYGLMSPEEAKTQMPWTPYGWMNQQGIDYLIEKGICKFEQGIWIFCMCAVDAKKRRIKDGVSGRSDESVTIRVPYMSYVFDYAVRRYQDLEQAEYYYSIRKVIEANARLEDFFDEVNDQRGYFGLIDRQQSKFTRKAPDKKLQTLWKTERVPF